MKSLQILGNLLELSRKSLKKRGLAINGTELEVILFQENTAINPGRQYDEFFYQMKTP